MMKSFTSIVVIVAALSALPLPILAARPKSDDLPQLHVILPFTFAAPYSCNGNYNSSALFLSKRSFARNHPELLYNGACGSQSYFQSDMAGRDMSVLSMLGDYPLESISAQAALNIRYLNPELRQANAFFTSIPAQANQTYSALLARDDLRVLMAFRVIDIVQDGPAKIEYVVLDYQRMVITEESSGWSWDGTNHY